LKSRYKIGYGHQSVQSVAGKLSCKITALKRWTKIEILWYRKLVSGALPVFSEILLPRSSRRWRADALKYYHKILFKRNHLLFTSCAAIDWW